jgi:hypothetical protein
MKGGKMKTVMAIGRFFGLTNDQCYVYFSPDERHPEARRVIRSITV